jgi:hypothetical protein
MYRGPPPEGKLYELTPEYQISLLKGRKFSVNFSSFSWSASESAEAKVRQKCAEHLARILEDENFDLLLIMKVSKKDLASVTFSLHFFLLVTVLYYCLESP